LSHYIPDHLIEEIRSQSDILDIISADVLLKKSGQNYEGLCPFHSEKTPSFVVSPEKQMFHCFGCHESGDLIAFAEKVEQLTFVEAVERIAVFAGISVVKEHQSPQEQRKSQLMEQQYVQPLPQT
jgi:DNA primase